MTDLYQIKVYYFESLKGAEIEPYDTEMSFRL